jgi:hypothetical protein
MAQKNAKINHSELLRVAAAIQKQVTNDFSRLWNATATVEALEFTELAQIPHNYWPVMVKAGANDTGFHGYKDGRVHAVVQSDGDEDWSVIASNECLEMLADPLGNRVNPGLSLKPDQGIVDYLVEVCDPCQGSTYKVDGVAVSNFCTPRYYNLPTVADVGYTFFKEDRLDAPLGIMPPSATSKGGFLRWYVPKDGHWWQAVNRGGVLGLDFTDLGVVDTTKSLGRSPRESVDMLVTKSAPPPRDQRNLTRRPEFYHLVYRLATDPAFYQRFKVATVEVYREYGMIVPPELLPHPVTLPSPSELKDALNLIDQSVGFAPPGTSFGAPLFSTCGFTIP